VPERRAGTVTFLFTDVEGSTRLVRQLRDRYPAVLADHRRLVRAAFARHGGEEVDTQGDAFFFVFARARDAAAAAADAQRALQAHAWPEDSELRVRMGLHTGEPVVSEEGYHGLGVHRAARIMAAGHGGQILASQATAAMLADDELPGVEQRDLGEFRLKDLDHPEHVYQLDVEGLPATFPPLRTGDAPTAYAGKEGELVEAAAGRRPLYRRPLVIGAFAGVLAAAVAIPVFALGMGSGGHADLEAVQDNAVAVVDAKSRAIVDESAEIASPQRVAAGEGSIWVTSSSGGGSVMRLDPESHDVIDTIEVDSGPVGIAVGAGAVWVASTLQGTVSRIDAASGRVVDTIDVGNTPTAVAFGANAVWVTNAVDRSVSKIDPATGVAGRPIDVEAAGRGIAVGGGAVWVTDPVGNELVRYDISSATAEKISVGSGPTAVAYGNGAVWVTNSLDGTVSRVDARRAIEADTIPVGAAPNGVAAAPDGAWVTDEVGGTLVHVDQASRETTATTLGGRPEGLTLADGSLWIAVQAGGAAHRGGTLRLVADSNYVESIDPPRAYAGWQLLSVAYDGLVGFKRVGGTDGNALVPDLARALPTPTGNGRTYTFRLQEGIKFADGSELRASAVRYSLERLFKAHPPRPDLYEGIVGGPACRKQPKRCDLSKSVLTDDDTGMVTIKLRAPDPDFLYKLALPFASVVPTGTPVTGNRPVPGTGPYRIAEYKPNRRVRLVRNRHFRVWSKAAQPEGVPDEIVLELGGTPDAWVTAVERGRADFLNSLFFPASRLQEVRTRYAAQLHITPTPFTAFVELNTTRPPFDDVRARRAVAYALDRRHLVDVFGGKDLAAPACQLLPPNFPGYQRYCPYTVRPTEGGAWTGPDLKRARKLIAESGTAGIRVDVTGPSGKVPFSAFTTSLVQTLRALGYRTSVRRQPQSIYFSSSSLVFTGAGRLEAAVNGWFPDYPAPSDFMIGNLACSSTSGFSCDPALDRKLRVTAQLQSRSPRAANEAWARLERQVIDRAIIVPVITQNAADFVSKRVRNYQRHPIFGMLISQVWVR
jgi:ABC-type transport system substrate-binding protein/class 3 adenylate cyclase